MAMDMDQTTAGSKRNSKPGAAAKRSAVADKVPVSYTHLTLPTSDLV